MQGQRLESIQRKSEVNRSYSPQQLCCNWACFAAPSTLDAQTINCTHLKYNRHNIIAYVRVNYLKLPKVEPRSQPLLCRRSTHGFGRHTAPERRDFRPTPPALHETNATSATFGASLALGATACARLFAAKFAVPEFLPKPCLRRPSLVRTENLACPII